MSKPTIQHVFEQLTVAMEITGDYGYRLDGDTILMETYQEDWNIVAVYPLTLTIGDQL